MASNKDAATTRRRRKSKSPPPEMSKLRIILFGKSLKNTSMVGNYILGRAAFETEAPPDSVKQHSERASGHVEGTNITIINAANLLNSPLKPEELKECVDLCAPGPHAFLLVIEPHNFTEEDKKQLGSLLKCFSEQVLNYAFVIGITKNSKMAKSGGQSNASQKLIEECGQRYRKYKQLQKNKNSRCTFVDEIKLVVKKMGGNFLICDHFKDGHEKYFQTDENLERVEERTTPYLSDDTKEKSSVMGTVLERIGLTTLLSEQKTGEHTARMPGSDSSLPVLNLVLCGSDDALKAYISDLILGPRKVKSGIVDRHILRLEVLPALYNTHLSDEEVMNEILRCISLDNSVHAFLFIIPVGPLTDDDKGEIETIQRIFSSRVCDHSVVLFTRENVDEAAASKFVEQSSEMEELRHMCGDRYMILEKEKKRRCKQVPELLEKVTNMKKIYSLQMYIEAQKDGAKQPLEDELAEMKKQLKAKTQEACAEDENSDSNRLRILLIGKTGNGKSATGITILGRKEFESDMSLTSVTRMCQKGIGEVQGRSVAVVDTPGLFDSTLSNEEVTEEIAKCVSMLAPGPHAFIIVLSLGRFTEDEKQTLNLIKMMFGPQAAKYSIVLFTGGDKLKNKTLEDYLRTSNHVHVNKLIRDCGGRVHLFNNNYQTDTTQVSELLQMIEEMIKFNRDNYFTNEMFEKAEMSIQQKQKEMLKEMEEQMQAKKEALKDKYEEELEKIKEREEALRREYEKKEEEEKEKQFKEKQTTEEERQRLKRMKDELQAERQKEIKKREKADKERKEQIDREREDMKNEYEMKKKELEIKFETDARRKAVEINDLEAKHKNHITDLIQKHQKDYQLLKDLYESAKTELDEKRRKENEAKKCIIL